MIVRLFEAIVKEPVLVASFVASVASLLVAVGLTLPVGLEIAVVGLIVSGSTLVARAFVSPV